MGIGLNASEQVPAISHILAPEKSIDIVLTKLDLTDEESTNAAVEFGKWIKANGLRELIDSFSIYLMSLYSAAYWISQQTNKISRMQPKTFEKRGVRDQLSELAKLIDVEAHDQIIVNSICVARNCYSRRQGRVGPPD